MSRAVLHLPVGTKAFDTVTINVPKDASPGEHYAVIWAEISAPAPAGGGVTLVNRVGVRMYVSIGPGGAPPMGKAVPAQSGHLLLIAIMLLVLLAIAAFSLLVSRRMGLGPHF